VPVALSHLETLVANTPRSTQSRPIGLVTGTTAGPLALDWPTVVRRQHEIVKEFQPLPESLARKGAEIILGGQGSSIRTPRR
jgi:hypothetical protein